MKISVIVTAYNLENCIGKCIDSVLAQTHKDLELIVVDDCSTDGTLDVLKWYNDNRMKVIAHSSNMGAGWSRRHGIDASTGDYVITVDGDDWIDVNFLEVLANRAEETDADIVSGGITCVYTDGFIDIKKFPVRVSDGMQKFRDYSNGRIVFLNNKIVRRKMYEQTPYCTRRYCEDTPVILPLLYYANMVAYADTQGYYYLQREESLCHKIDNFGQALFKALCSQDCQQFFADKGDEYQNLISKTEYVTYLRTIKYMMNDELAEKYRYELGELTPSLLNLIRI